MPPDEAFDLKPGDVLANKFRVEQVLGVGGMGVVAAVWHLELRARVALKLLLPGKAISEAAIERFAREASAMSRMRSEYVVRVFDVGRLPNDGPPFMVMEYLVGEDFESLLAARKTLDAEEAAGFVLQACEGTAEAHSLGIVHRDLKPANLFLTRRVDGSKLVKVVDFGIAKEQTSAASVSLTGPLVALGSPQYMSPEQTRAATDIDSSADIWALGVCLYEMLTGAPPFDAPSVAEVTAGVLMNDPPTPHEARGDIAPELSAVVMRCLEKRREDRFSDVAALAAALEPFAPKAQRGAAARIAAVLGKTTTEHRATSPDLGDAPSPLVMQEEHRSDDLGVPEAETRKKIGSRRALLLAVLVLSVIGLLVAGIGWRRAANESGEVASTPSATPGASVPTVASSEELPSIALQSATNRAPLASAEPRASAAPHASAGGKRPGAKLGRTFPESEPAPSTVAVAAPTTTAADVPSPAPQAPRFVLASARVETGAATNTFGTTATNVGRVMASLGDRMTACYRASLPQMSEPLAGAGTLHIETDEEGIITVARVAGGITAPAACIRAAVVGRKLPNVDTGRARADVSLVFRAQ